MVVESFLSTGTAVSSELAVMAERARPSVVEVRTRRGAGTGIVWAADGLIITNSHVVAEETARVTLADGRVVTGAVERRAATADLAALRVPLTGLTAMEVGDSASLRVGELVVAVGNPFGLPRVVTLGIVSAEMTDIRERLTWEAAIHSGLQLRPGNSGGPLLDAAGRVVGVNTMVTGERRALSIPSHTVVAFLNGSLAPPRLGVTIQVAALRAPARVGAALLAAGLLITAVDDGGPADAAGLLPGDILVAAAFQTAPDAPADERPLLEPADLAWLLSTLPPGASVTLRLLRAGELVTAAVTPIASA